MKRREFIIGAGSAAIGGSALIGSSAFSQIDAQRSVTIELAEDPDAYLGMDKCSIDGSETPNSSYAHLDDDGHLEILMNEENPTIGESPLGEGINSDSRMFVDNVFQLCNQGKEDVCVYIEDDEDWPQAPEEYDERRVDFYLGDARDETVVGEDNEFLLQLGECVCIGLKTNSKELSEGDELLEELDNEIRIIADTDGDCFGEPACPILDGQYQCTTYEEENGQFTRTGTRFLITNEGASSTEFDLAVADQPASFRGDVTVGGNTSRSVVTDASVPQNAVIAWNPPEGCEGDLQTWGEYKTDVGVDDLHDWYTEFGTSDPPPRAPQDFDDEFVVEVKDIPEQENDPGDTLGPDEFIDEELYPDMSEEAEEEGWITCEKELNGSGSTDQE